MGLVLTCCLLSAAPAAPAASGALSESCTVMEPNSAIEVSSTLDTDLPASMPLGASAKVTTTASVTIPETVTAFAYTSLGARTVDGLAQFETDLTGPGLTNVSGTIAKTTVPPTGALTVQLTGLPQTFTPAAVGLKIVKGYVYLTALRFHDAADHTDQLIVVCSVKATNPAQDTTIDTVSVVAPAQATTTVVSATYGKRATLLKTRIAVTNSSGTAATGKVVLTIRRGKVKVRTARVRLRSGVASRAFKGISHPGEYLVVARYKGSPTSEASHGKARITVP